MRRILAPMLLSAAFCVPSMALAQTDYGTTDTEDTAESSEEEGSEEEEGDTEGSGSTEDEDEDTDTDTGPWYKAYQLADDEGGCSVGAVAPAVGLAWVALGAAVLRRRED